ncbi:MAG TPA: hypothetical protein VLL52_25980 [Anaerolineae bacterium]|nr:hypothetical protein [Anaerolineae bacterium]
MNKKTSYWTRWGFTVFGGLLVIINAALTFAFGYTYLGAAFGTGVVAAYAGAFYTLLLFDIGYLSWFWTFVRTAESTSQRALALGMAIFSLIGSLAATLQQLATNATALVDLSAYHQTVGMIALGTMLFMTTTHIIATAAYVLLDPRERVKQVMAAARATALDDSLAVAEKMIALDHKEMIDIMSANVRSDILASLGFTADLQHLTGPTASPAPLELAAPQPSSEQEDKEPPPASPAPTDDPTGGK